MENQKSISRLEYNNLSSEEVLNNDVLIGKKELLKKIDKNADEFQKYIIKYWDIERQFKDVQEYEVNKLSYLQRQRQEYENYIYNNQDQLINFFNSLGSCIFQDINKNIFSFKFNMENEFTEGSRKTISTLLSKVYGRRIIIIDDIYDIKINPTIDNTVYVLTTYIPILLGSVFNIYSDIELYKTNNLWYRNLFTYTSPLKKRLFNVLERYDPFKYYDLFDQLPISVWVERGEISFYQTNFTGTLDPIYDTQPEYTSYQIEVEQPIFKLFNINRNPILGKQNQIKEFIFLFVNENIHQFNYIMNWLAYFFQNLFKSKIALVLLGDTEITEKLFWDRIILPIFGSKFCIKINDENLETKVDKEIIENKIFFNFSIISSKYEKRIQTLLERTLIETYLEPDSNATKIFGQTLITSNTPYEFIKSAYSKCTIIRVDDLDNIIRKLNLTDRISLIEIINNDLDDFANILAQYPISHKFANYALNTEERELLSKSKNNTCMKDEILDGKVTEFITEIKNLNIEYFEKVKDVSSEIYEELKDSLKEKMIVREELSFYFNTIYGKEYFLKNSELLEVLKNRDELFNQYVDKSIDKETKEIIYKGNETSKLNKKQYKIQNYELKKNYTKPKNNPFN